MTQETAGSVPLTTPTANKVAPEANSRSMATTWHTDTAADVESRRIVIHQIVQLLEQCKPEAFAERKDKLIDLARRLEVALYKASNSKAEYMDTSTLRQRVRDLAKASGAAQARPQQRQFPSKDGENRPPSTQQPSQQMRMMASNGRAHQSTAAGVHRGVSPATSNSRVAVGNTSVTQKSGQAGMPTSLSGSNGVGSRTGASTNGSQQQTQMMQHELQRAQILKQRQQRLLLLRHASKCPAKDGECKMSSYCAPMKTLWVHIAKCKNQRCQVPHCVSSRYVLSHYHQCKDVNCPVCKPVRSMQPMQKKRQRELTPEELVQIKRIRLQQQQLQQQQKKQQEQLALKTKSLDPAVAAREKQRLARAQQLQRQQYLARMQQQQQQILQKKQQQAATAAPGKMVQRKYTPQQMQMLQMRRAQSQMKFVIDPKFARSCKSGTGPSMPLSMTALAISAHLRFLKVERLQSSFTPFVRRLMEHKHNRGVFNEPVDPIALNIPEYTKLIKHPMDLGTVRRRLDEGHYPTLKKLQSDMRLVFSNAIKFNPPGHGVHDMASLLLKVVDQDVPKIEQKMDKETRSKKDKKCQLCFQLECEVCPLCERGCVPYEPKMLYCAGPCAGRIARNGQFYSSPGSSYSWCQDCFDKCKTDALTVNNVSYPKQNMVKKKNNDLFAEPWVSCDRCERWCHQVCALFNPRKNDSKNPRPYVCPICLLADAEKAKLEGAPNSKTLAITAANQATKTATPPKKRPQPKSSSRKSPSTKSPKSEAHTLIKVPAEKSPPGALELPHTRLGQFVERWVRDKLGAARRTQQNREDYGTSWSVGPPPEHLYIRVVDNHDELCKVKPYVKTVQGYPHKLPYRSRNISLFQKLDGVDVLIFALYVQEYGSDCPEPNSRKIYIAYLDSVHYFRPRQLRTMVYQELLIAYLEYSRRRGFTSAYIWACPPPNKRDDYILHCHPEDQRVPSADRLRKWYHGLIRRGAERQEFVGSCALYEEHFVDNKQNRSKKNSKKKKTTKKTKSKKQKGKSKKGGKKGSSTIHDKDSSKMGLPLAKQVSLVEGVGALNEDDDEDGMNNFLENLPNMDTEVDDRVGNESPIGGGAEAEGAASAALSAAVAESGEPASLPNVCPATGQKFLVPENGIKTGDDRMLPADLERRKSNKLALRGHIPYFEGDYWPQEAEELAKDIMNKAKKESEKKAKAAQDDSTGRGGRKRRRNGEEIGDDASVVKSETSQGAKTGKVKKEPNDANGTVSKKDDKKVVQKPKNRAEAKAMAIAAQKAKEEAIAAEVRKLVSKEALIDKKLAEQLAAMKDDFLVVKMAHECTRCGKYLLRGRWECRHPDCSGCAFNQSPPFALCNSCYILECERPVECQHGGGCVAPKEAGVPLEAELDKRMEDGKDQTRLLMENSFHHQFISLDEDQRKAFQAQQLHMKESIARIKAGLPPKPFPGVASVGAGSSNPTATTSEPKDVGVKTEGSQNGVTESKPDASKPTKNTEAVGSTTTQVKNEQAPSKPPQNPIEQKQSNTSSEKQQITAPVIVAPKTDNITSENVTTPSPKEERPAPTADVKEMSTSSQAMRLKLEGSSTSKETTTGSSQSTTGATEKQQAGSTTNGPQRSLNNASASDQGTAPRNEGATQNPPSSSTNPRAAANVPSIAKPAEPTANPEKKPSATATSADSEKPKAVGDAKSGSTATGTPGTTFQRSVSAKHALPKLQFPIPIVKKSKEEQEREWAAMPLGCSRKTGKPTNNHVLHFVDENMPVNTPFYDKVNRNQLLESRHAFLSLCTGNRYQFDQLRRAKFSTMMVLYHLHNPEAPAHLYTCTNCHKDILGGKRYHCDLCNGGDYDLCQQCMVNGVHREQGHKLNPIEIIKGVELESTETKRSSRRKLDQQRARSLQIFLDALQHASSCREKVCRVEGCIKMRELLNHRERCHVRVRGGCEICKRVMCLVQMHVRKCPVKQCPVPHCDDVKRLMAEQIKAQQIRAAQIASAQAARARRLSGAAGGTTLKNRGGGRGGTMKATVVAGSGGTKIKIKTSGTTIKPPGASPLKPPKAKKPKLTKK